MKNKTDLKQKANPKQTTTLRFTPTAWAKLLFLRDAGDTEVGGFGISAEEDLLLVRDIGLVRQSCTWAYVAFDDHAVADFFDEQVDAGQRPEQFARIWIHTHPGNCPQPSLTDEQTFARVFGHTDWALMFILARGGQTFARLRYNIGPGADVLIPVEVDFGRPFDGTDFENWREQYEANVRVPLPEPVQPKAAKRSSTAVVKSPGYDDWRDDGQPPADWYEDWSEYTLLDDPRKESDELGYVHDF